jgi:hypothetical protein
MRLNPRLFAYAFTAALVTPLFVVVVDALEPAPRPQLRTIDVVVVRDNNGGIVDEFLSLVGDYRAANARVEIKGKCYSACTLFTGVARACVYDDTELHFHAPFLPVTRGVKEFDHTYTANFIANYPAGIQQWIASKGGLGDEWIVLKGEEMLALIPHC